MNEEMQKEEQKETEKTGNFWQDKALPFLKKLWADKITFLYVCVFALQLLFLLLQFLPIVNMAIKAKVSLFGGVNIEMKRLSMLGAAKTMDKELGASIFTFFFIVSTASTFFALFSRSIPYFVRKKEKIGKGFMSPQICLGFYMLQFVVFTSLAKGMANEIAYELSESYGMAENSLFSLTGAGNLYWMVALALFIVQWVLSIKIKEKKEEDKINARVSEELKKQNAQTEQE